MEYNALTLCKTLIGIINISQRLFHLRMKKKEYWVRLAYDARDLINKWYESDKKRYSEFIGDVS